MKLKYYLMGAALVAMGAGFSACSDSDDEPQPVENNQTADLTLSAETQRVKIGAENRVALPVATGNGEYDAYSLNPEVADIYYDEAGTPFIEGFRNGSTKIVVSDAASKYTQLPVSVYTTETMTLNKTSMDFVTTMGYSATASDLAVELGNGDYSVVSDNPKVKATINAETGVVTITATAGAAEYTANVTVSDCTGLTATCTVTVKPTFDGFVQSDIDELLAKTSTTIDYNGRYPYTFRYLSYGYYGGMVDEEADGLRTVGYKYEEESYWSSSIMYTGIMIRVPVGTAVNTEVDGTLLYGDEDDAYDEHNGKVKILQDDEEKFIAIWWEVDMVAEKINRGYIVWDRVKTPVYTGGGDDDDDDDDWW